MHRIFMLALDLDELDAVHRATRWLSVNAGNLYSFRETDYLPVDEPVHNATKRVPRAAPGKGAPRTSLQDRVLGWLRAHGTDLPGGRVTLVTLPRVAGYQFNPVSFYFCYDDSGRPSAAIAEVTNTFREVKPYLLGPETWRDGAFRLRVPKHFYVSPYSDVDVAFDFVLRPPGDRLDIRIDDYAGETRTLASTLTGTTRPLTSGTLAWFTLKHPFVTLATMTFIHLHALALFLKSTPWFAKSARPGDQRDLFRPHASILPHAVPQPAPATIRIQPRSTRVRS